MKIALLSPIAWRTPPRHYGPWEKIVSLIAEGLVERGMDVTLFATGDSITTARLEYICSTPYEENKDIDPKVWEALHIANLFERAEEFDIIHNHYDFLPLCFSRMVTTPMITTIHGFSSAKILPVYQKYNRGNYYVSISNADRSPSLDYIATVYHGIDLREFTYVDQPGDYLVYFGRIHPDKGTYEAIEIAAHTGMKLYLAGIIQDYAYFRDKIAPRLDNQQVVYLGSIGPVERNTLLGNAFALLHPIFFHEPFGLSVIESMACGTPVIAFNKGSMPEVIKDQQTGFLVNNVREACECIPKIAAIERKNCRNWVEKHFSREAMVDNYLSLYQQILQ
ncbi:MAG: glycosyltransferase family 4 protein [Syntrophomonadaceae bacterium]|nr:glycosyltransferase family 4 protein [Syntrophomonadaceae bacterium]